MNRRVFLKGMAGGVAALSAPIFLSKLGVFAQKRPLTISLAGGIWLELHKEFLFDPFEEEFGIEINEIPEPAADPTLKFKKMIEAGEPAIDIAVMQENEMPKAAELGIFQTWSPDEIPLLENVNPGWVTERDGQIVGVGYTGWFQGFTINTDLVAEPYPYSWAHWWDPRFEDRGMIGAPLPTAWWPWITAEVFYGGQEILGTEEGIERVFKTMEGTLPQIKMTWESEAEGQQTLKAGDVALLEMYNDVSLVMEARGWPVKRIYPREGGILGHGEWCLLMNSPMREEARTFINYTLRPDVQTRFSSNIWTIPAIKNHNVSEEDMKKFAPQGVEHLIQPRLDILLEFEELLHRKWEGFLARI